ncbi:MAG: succinate dehydrogenase [Flavobacterium sp. BFFFF1]|uniref:succinate dehydrogenase cytochrome b subunit n=1 Tax=unclassified Flavobacterium TaxID=196869 RepID=UPI000BDB09DB|nr:MULTISPECIES: succinate dehydrogenase cytochrome b subunit [unclassified Flavobacterium]OYU79854.1 MAG: succinate dehydrogenase [Flavobacterium sp. BFFFF1]
MAQTALLKSSIARKVAMALSGMFLVLFLGQHFFINFTSVFGPDNFNAISQFMGYNPLVQYIIQPILIFGIVFHFIMGIYLDIQNKNARPIKYAKNNGAANASWASRNMVLTGLVVLAFLGLHFYDFWVPEIAYKYVSVNEIVTDRYYDELVHKFHDPIRTGIYCLSFAVLAVHLWHGFASSFQSVGFSNKYSRGLSKFAYAFAVIVPLGFIFIALFHHFNH